MEPVLFADWYTDPFCSWSYAAEGPIGAFRQHFGSRLSFRHRLFPLYRNIAEFLQKHGLSSQQEFSPRIEKVSRMTGVSMSPRVWETGQAPQSTEDCCLFVEAALLSDPVKGEAFLSRLRELAFLEGRDIGDPELLGQTATALGIDRARLEDLLRSGVALAALAKDQEKARLEGVTVRPTLILTNSEGDRVFIGGLRNPDLFILAGETLIREAS
ncbi:MAG: hypothetical protein D084_Lepto4C00326G0003 [Leptospirillum sp. Group IV 'UBA BS']|nr:MAG: hypothetical protein D084_Lepto4C00326G0003 [Leptospirillum sp. Group IV 'UBA BS']